MSKNRDFVSRSHERSRLFGVTSDQMKSKRMLNEKELDKVIKDNQELIAVSEPLVNKLYSYVRDSKFLVILTDRNGCILSIIGDRKSVV